MKPYRLHPEVVRDVDDAAGWYEREEPGLGVEFVLAVEAAIDTIARGPRAWRHWPGAPTELAVRRFTMERFPFLIGYVDEPDEIVVLVVDHGKRRPLHWLKRARSR